MSVQEFDEIYKQYYAQVYAYIRKLCQDETLAEEITQETFFKVLKKIDTYRGECKLNVWMCQIAKNLFLNHLKKQKKVTEYELEKIEQEDHFEQALINKETALRIHEILHTLEEPYKEVFWMRTFGELSFEEIGKVHGKTVNWARVTYHRAKMRIKEEIEFSFQENK